jgi:hypothetical protein
MDFYNLDISLNPKVIKSLSELEKVISVLEEYGENGKHTSFVVYIQSALGSSYDLMIKESLDYFKKNHSESEKVLKEYPIQFYKNMRKQFNNFGNSSKEIIQICTD